MFTALHSSKSLPQINASTVDFLQLDPYYIHYTIYTITVVSTFVVRLSGWWFLPLGPRLVSTSQQVCIRHWNLGFQMQMEYTHDWIQWQNQVFWQYFKHSFFNSNCWRNKALNHFRAGLLRLSLSAIGRK